MSKIKIIDKVNGMIKANLGEKEWDSIIYEASNGKFNGLKDIQESELMLSDAWKNEFLEKMKGVLNRQIIIEFFKISNPYAGMFHKGDWQYGDFEQFIQNMDARLSTLEKHADFNDHWKAESKTQYVQTVIRNRYDVSISTELINNVFLGYGEMNKWLSSYMNSIQKTRDIVWLDIYTRLFQTTDIIAKMPEITEKSNNLNKWLDLLISKLQQTSTKFNKWGIPTYNTINELVLIINRKAFVGLNWDGIGNTYSYTSIQGGLKEIRIIFQDFTDNETVGWIGDNSMSFWIDDRLNTSGVDKFARTLIADHYEYEFKRMARMYGAQSVRLVKHDSTLKTGDKIDPWLSPISSQWEDQINLEDNLVIKDVTAEIDSEWREIVETNVALNYAIRNKKFVFGPEVTADNLIAEIKKTNPLLNVDSVEVVSFTEDRFILRAIKPYVVNSDTDEMEYRFKRTGASKAVKKDLKIALNDMDQKLQQQEKLINKLLKQIEEQNKKAKETKKVEENKPESIDIVEEK